MTRIKICGVREPGHALAAAAAGAHYIGMIFYPASSRYLPPEEARRLCQTVRTEFPEEGRPQLVGVFVNAPPGTMEAVRKFCGLDLVQLSGDEGWELCYRLPYPTIRAVRVLEGTCGDDVVDELDRELPSHQARGGLCLLEPRVEERYGGTGHQMDWRLAAVAAQRHPFLLSGGLSPANVAAAVAQVRPWGVDVSSGVETAGRKDAGKIRTFIQAVREADATVMPEA